MTVNEARDEIVTPEDARQDCVALAPFPGARQFVEPGEQSKGPRPD